MKHTIEIGLFVLAKGDVRAIEQQICDLFL